MAANSIIDLRSDSVTRPTAAMREAMARAPVGDDVFGEDPSVNALEGKVAALLGKEAAVFVPSGTAANQIALLVHCRPGDDVIVGDGTHLASFESGAAGALAGVQITTLGVGRKTGRFDPIELASAVKPGDPHFPSTRLVVVEDPHDGWIWPLDELRAVVEAARGLELASHLDGARLWNAQVASGVPAPVRAASFDTVTVCLSKGLGAPVGSVLAGSRSLIAAARRYRKMLGGGMRQTGILAAGALHALEHHLGRLAEDHANARHLARRVAEARYARIDEPQTNIVFINIGEGGPQAAEVAVRARTSGVLVAALGPKTIRAVTHLDVDREACDHAATILTELLSTMK